MTMAGKTKVYLSLIGAALVGLAVDKCYFGATAPAPTNAGELDTEVTRNDSEGKSAQSVRVSSNTSGAPKRNVPQLHFPRHLPSYDSAYELRDVFAPIGTEGIEAAIAQSGKGKSGKDTAAGTIGRDAFEANHRVDAVMVQESLKIALVDGRWVRVGDMVDGCELTGIEGNSVLFECHDGVTELSPSGKRKHPTG